MATGQECCPKFDPASWQERWLALDGKQFVRDRVRSFLRIPLNFGAVMARNVAAIQQAGAEAKDMLVLSDENSLWGSDVYLEVARDVLTALLTLHAQSPAPDAPLVVYGEACRLGPERLKQARVTFRHIPHDVRAG